MDELRRAASRQIAKGDWESLATVIEKALRDCPSQRAYGLVGGWVDDIRLRVPPLRQRRLVVLRSFTVEPVTTALKCWAAAMGLFLDVDVQPYEQFEQIILDANGALSKHADAVMIAPRLRELSPTLERRMLCLTAADRLAAADAAARRMAGWLDLLRNRLPTTHLFMWGLPVPPISPLGLADTAVESGHRQLIRGINDQVAARCRGLPDAHFVDVDCVLSGVGYEHAFDPRMDAIGRQPFSTDAITRLSHHVARCLAAATLPRKKCLALDCDNTLWGGVVGEEGPEGIALGSQYPGSAYVAFQEDLLALQQRGVILAIASKNNEGDVLQVLDRHPHQVLRRDHFAARRVSWDDKASSLAALAQELGIGLDSFVFVDDSEVECALVREVHPEVDTVVAPKEPLELAGLVQRLHQFDALRISDEDFRRGELYLAQTHRSEAERTATTVDDFLRTLEMEMQIEPVRTTTAQRVAQLTQRTNQFNLTTRRYLESDIRRFVDSPEHEVFSVHLRDRFGDYGICGAAVLVVHGDALAIDVLLLSCRVIGRSIEDALIPFLQRRAQARRASALIGEYIATPKNAQVQHLFSRFGFEKVLESATETRWSWNASLPPAEQPDIMKVEIAAV